LITGRLPPSQAERFVFERIFSLIVNRWLAEKYYRITMLGPGAVVSRAGPERTSFGGAEIALFLLP
jgi:hypothetical protein